jgi:hypothetical protein
MYDIASLRTAFTSLVGILQSNLPQVPAISPPLSVSNSLVYVQDKHALVSLENIWYAAPLFNPNDYPAWVSLYPYTAGASVFYSGLLYQAKNNVTSATSPNADPTNWAIYNPFQAWLQQKYNQAVSNLFAAVVIKKKLTHMQKAIMDRVRLYTGGGTIYQKVLSTSSFVGFEIVPQSAEGLLVFIDSVGIQSDTAQLASTLTYYLYHSTVATPLLTWDAGAISANTFAWKDLKSGGNFNAILEYLQYNTSGSYFFGYYQDDLVGSVLSKNWDCGASPCYSCNGSDLGLFNQWSKWVTLRNIQVQNKDLDIDRNLFNTNNIVRNNLTNWGLNMSITVRCDLTKFIIYNPLLWADAFAFQLAKEFLEAIAMSTRINPTNNQIQVAARSELDKKFTGAWINKYYDSLEALNIDLSGFSRVCQPCDDSKKIKWGTI